MLEWVKRLDSVSKFFLTAVFSIIVYLFLLFLIGAVLGLKLPKLIMNFSHDLPIILNVVCLLIALFIGFLFSAQFLTPESEKAFKIVKSSVTPDEKMILEELKKAEVITQDSLRFRLNWSKAKTSTLLTNLDKKGLIIRERSGKTFKVCLPDYYKKFGI